MAWQLRPVFPNGAFVPDFEHGSGTGDCVDGGGHCPETDNGLTPLGRLSRLRQPGQAVLNLARKRQHETQVTGENRKNHLPSNAAPLARDEPQATAGDDAKDSERRPQPGDGASRCRWH
jgi:hypothetical protein